MRLIQQVRKTFDWEYVVRFLAATTVLYVVGSAVLHVHARPGPLGGTSGPAIVR